MGNATSSTAEARDALSSLELLAGPAVLPLEDARWQPLLGFPLPLASWPGAEVQALIKPSCTDLGAQG